jgi:hypothetical protein
MNQTDTWGNYGNTTYTINNPIGCPYNDQYANMTYEVIDGGGIIQYPITHSQAFGDRTSTMSVRWQTTGTHRIAVTWRDCLWVITQIAYLDVTVSDGSVNTSAVIMGTSTSTIYPEPYICDNNLNSLQLTTSLNVGSCASSVSNQLIYLERYNATTNAWGFVTSPKPLFGGAYTQSLSSLFGANNLTANANQNIYRVRTQITTNAPGTKTFTTPSFRIVSMGTYNVDYFYINTQGQNVPIPTTGNTCSNPIPVSKFDSPTISGVSNTGIIDKYWIKIYDATGCPTTQPLIVDGSTNKRTLPTRTLGDIVGLSLDAYYRQIKAAQGATTIDNNYFINHPNRVYRIDLYGENVCTGTIGIFKRSFITNNCLSCRSVGGSNDNNPTERLTAATAGTVLLQESAAVYPNPVSASATLEYHSLSTAEMVFSIYDLQGRIVKEEKINTTAGDNTFVIDCTNLSKGLYLFKVGQTSGKFIKE